MKMTTTAMTGMREILRDAERVYDFLAGAPAASGKADLILAAGSGVRARGGAVPRGGAM